MNYNLLTSKSGIEANIPYKVDEVTFWKHYLHLLNLTLSKKLTNKELDFFALILSKQEGVSYFSKPHYKALLNSELKLSYSEIVRLRDKLLSLNLVETSVNKRDKRKNITLPKQSFRSLQKYIKANKKLCFIFNYEIT